VPEISIELRCVLPGGPPPRELRGAAVGSTAIEAHAITEDDEDLELRLRLLCEGWIRKVIRNRNEAAQIAAQENKYRC
jgi:hypothetical protein